MPAHVNPKQKPRRASFVRMLAHITFGFGFSTGATLIAPSAFGQSCDKCAGMIAPSCGCELPSCKQAKAKPKPCTCIRKPSVGELILGHFDRVGDQIEARAKKSGKGATCGCESPNGPSCGCESAQGPTCGCETPQSPSCGCEICSRTDVVPSVPMQLPPIQSALLRPNVGPTVPNAKGVLVDKQRNTTPPPPGKQPVAKKQDLDTSVNSVELSDPKVQRVPFENRNSPSNSTNRIPAVEAGPNTTTPSIPNVLKPIPSDIPPAWTPNALPPKAKTTVPTDSKLPDVLVDPFKDDLSSRGKNKSLIQLTSDRQITSNSLRSSPSDHSEGQSESLNMDRPARLTPKQKLSTSQETTTGSLQFEASEASANEGSKVVSSSYLHAIPVPVVVRKDSVQDKLNGVPSVPKMRVPAKR